MKNTKINTNTKIQCQCGYITGGRCNWQGPSTEMVLVEWMPESIRSSHQAAGNRGRFPMNGSIRLPVERSCASMMIEAEPEWIKIVAGDVEDYVEAN